MTDEQVKKIADAIRDVGSSVTLVAFMVTVAIYFNTCMRGIH